MLTYDEVSTLPTGGGLAFVDMAGSPGVRRAVHEHAADDLRASIMVGATHWEGASFPADRLPGPAPEFSFAPARAEQRAAELGPGPLQRRIGEAWAAFAERVPDLLDFEHGSGVEAVGRAYDALVDGSADPARGVVLSL